MPIKAILFDKDGTLIDFNATWGNATYEVLSHLSAGNRRKLNQLAEVTLYDLDEKTISHRSPLIGDSPMELAQLWAQIIGRDAGSSFESEINALFTEESVKQLTGFDETEPALKNLQADGYALGIATNDSESTARLHMEKLQWTHYFDAIYGYDSGHGPKPGPGMVDAFVAHTGFDPGEVAMIGDSLHDIRAGKAAGSFSIGVATGPWDTRKLREEADAVIEDLSELASFLLQHNTRQPI